MARTMPDWAAQPRLRLFESGRESQKVYNLLTFEVQCVVKYGNDVADLLADSDQFSEEAKARQVPWTRGLVQLAGEEQRRDFFTAKRIIYISLWELLEAAVEALIANIIRNDSAAATMPNVTAQLNDRRVQNRTSTEREAAAASRLIGAANRGATGRGDAFVRALEPVMNLFLARDLGAPPWRPRVRGRRLARAMPDGADRSAP